MNVAKRFDKFLNDWEGKKVEVYDPSNKDQCVDLFLKWLEYLDLGHLIPIGIGPAYEIWTKNNKITQYFEKIPNTPDYVPMVGDVIVWKPGYGGVGHVAMATRGSTKSRLSAFSQNDPLGAPAIVVSNYPYSYVYGGMRLKGATYDDMSNTTDPELQVKASNFDDMKQSVWGDYNPTRDEVKHWASVTYPSERYRSGEWDEFVQWHYEDPNLDTNTISAEALKNSVGGLKGLNTTVNTQKALLKSANELISSLKSEVLNLKKIIKTLQGQPNELQERVTFLEGQRKTLTTEKEDLRIKLIKCQSSKEVYKEGVIQRLTNYVKTILEGILK